MSRRSRNKQMVIHDFYCINCGKKGLPLPRPKGSQKQPFHRKKLYCFNCQKEVNHIECRCYSEVERFLEEFAAGAYSDEAETSLNSVEREYMFYD